MGLVGLIQNRHGRLHQADQLGPLQQRLRKPVIRLDQQLDQRNFQRLLPEIERAERQVSGLFLLTFDLSNLYVHSPRRTRARFLAVAGRLPNGARVV